MGTRPLAGSASHRPWLPMGARGTPGSFSPSSCGVWSRSFLSAARSPPRRSLARPCARGRTGPPGGGAPRRGHHSFDGARGGRGGTAAPRSSLALARGARDAAKEALAKTPEQLDVLQQAGVVDSGWYGTRACLRRPVSRVRRRRTTRSPERGPSTCTCTRCRDESCSENCATRSCTCLTPTTEDAAFREVWAGLRDSIVIVGGEGLYNCHIHTDDDRRRHRGGGRRGSSSRHPGHRPQRTGHRRALGTGGIAHAPRRGRRPRPR